MDRYQSLSYRHQTEARGLLDERSLAQTFRKWSRWYARRLKDHLPRDKNALCLDLPCGFGNMLYCLRDLGYTRAVGYDTDPEQVRLACLLDLPAHVGSAETVLGDESTAFDCILSLDFIEHLSRDDAVLFLERATAHLRPGGVLILRTPSADGPFGAHDAGNDITHQWFMSANTLRTLLQMVGLRRVVILDERPQPYNWLGALRVLVFHPARWAASLLCLALGLTPPTVWSRSMWGVGYKDP